MVKYSPIPTRQESETHMWNGGIDSVNDPLQLARGKFVDCKNVNLTDTGPRSRIGATLLGAVGSAQINGIGVIKRESGDIIIRAAGTKLQKLVGTTWTDVADISAIATLIVSYDCSDLTNAALATGTATAESTGRTMVKSGGGMTLNAYSAKILRITSGTGSGQEKFITSNDLTTLYVEGIFETAPDVTSVFDIRNISGHVIVTNGTDTAFKYDGTTVTTFPTMTKWHSLEVAHNRLFGSRRDNDMVYVSNLGTDYFPKDNYIPVDPDGDSIVGIVKNLEEVIVYKKNARKRITGYDEDTFSIISADERVGAISQGSIAHGNNYCFFLGYGGVYSVNSLDSSSLDEGLPISENINDKILAHPASELRSSVGWVADNRYFISVGNEVFVYDIMQSQKVKSHAWTRYEYAQPISSALVHGGVTYLGTATKTLTVGGTSDDGAAISCEIITGRITNRDKNQSKVYNRDYVNFLPSDTTVTVYAAFDGGAFEQIAVRNIATDSRIRTTMNRRAYDVSYKYVFPGTHTPHMSSHEQFFTRLTKTI